jgi:hypothetical protein
MLPLLLRPSTRAAAALYGGRLLLPGAAAAGACSCLNMCVRLWLEASCCCQVLLRRSTRAAGGFCGALRGLLEAGCCCRVLLQRSTRATAAGGSLLPGCCCCQAAAQGVQVLLGKQVLLRVMGFSDCEVNPLVMPWASLHVQ